MRLSKVGKFIGILFLEILLLNCCSEYFHYEKVRYKLINEESLNLYIYPAREEVKKDAALTFYHGGHGSMELQWNFIGIVPIALKRAFLFGGTVPIG